MPFFQNAQNTDARYGTFNEYAGDQRNYRRRSTGNETMVERGEEVAEAKPKHRILDFSDHVNGWNVCVHPDGWKYFSYAGLVTDDERVANRPPPVVRHDLARQLSKGSSVEDPSGEVELLLWYVEPKGGCGDLEMMKTYVNHSFWYASFDKDTVNRTDHTPEDGELC